MLSRAKSESSKRGKCIRCEVFVSVSLVGAGRKRFQFADDILSLLAKKIHIVQHDAIPVG